MEKKIAKIGIIMVLALALILSSLGALNLGDTFAKEFDVKANETSVREWGGVSHSKLGASSNQLIAQAATTPTPWDGTIAKAFAGGDGVSAATAYEISNGAELAYFAQQVNGSQTYSQDKYFKLTADIVLNDTSKWTEWTAATTGLNKWTPIGKDATNSFLGKFNGDGHTVSGMYINDASSGYIGLFGYVLSANTYKADVNNLGVINSYISCKSYGGSGELHVGGVVGYLRNASINNCYNTGAVNVDSDKSIKVGGIVGYNGGKIVNCYNTGALTVSSTHAGNFVGGIAGYSDGGIDNCYNHGNVTGKDCVGGVVGGTIRNIDIKTCYNSGKVASSIAGATFVGGVVGNDDGSRFSNCYFLTGQITIGGEPQNPEKASGSDTRAGFGHFIADGTLTSEIGTIIAGETVLVEALNASVSKFEGMRWAAVPGGYPKFKSGGNVTITWKYPTAVPEKPFSGGDGSVGSPYLISTPQELANMSYLINTNTAPYNEYETYYKLTADIILNDTTNWENWSDDRTPNGVKYWTPIGNGTNKFKGSFDGDGHVVSGIYINNYYTADQGLFGAVDGRYEKTPTEIKNVGVINSCIIGKNNVGGVVGNNAYGKSIINCFNTGNVTSLTTDYNVEARTGGVVGNNIDGKPVINCYNTGKVKGSNACVGGVVGISKYDGKVLNCYNTGAVTGAAKVGGVVGNNQADLGISNCYNSGAVTGTSSIGGVVGENWRPVKNCYFLKTGSINNGLTSMGENNTTATCGTFDSIDGVLTAESGGSIIGGNTNLLAALKAGAEEYNATNPTPTIKATNWVTVDDNYPTVDDATYAWYTNEKTLATFEISTARDLKGLSNLVNGTYKDVVGLVDNTAISFKDKTIKLTKNIVLNDTSNWENWETSKPTNVWKPIGTYERIIGAVPPNPAEKYIPFEGTFDGDGYTVSGVYINSTRNNQGLFGMASGSTIKNLGVVNSYIKGEYFVGGIVGKNTDNGKVVNCYNTGAVNGREQVGGIVGQNGATVANCYNQGYVTFKGNNGANTYIGGVAGANSGAITNCYNTGNVTSISSNINSKVGGLVGNSVGAGAMTNCYFLKNSDTNIALTAVGGGIATATCGTFGGIDGKLTVETGALVGDNLIVALNAGSKEYNTTPTPSTFASAWLTVKNDYPNLIVTLTINGTDIYANGLAITLKAGATAGVTNIYYDKDLKNNGQNATPIDLSKIDGFTFKTAKDYDLSTYTVYGGGRADATIGIGVIDLFGDTSVTMKGGKVTSINGGGNGAAATVAGSATVTISGGTITGNVVGGGTEAAKSTVTGTKTVNVSGNPIIGAAAKGIIINGGTTPVANGVDSFIINGALTGANGNIKIVWPAGYRKGTAATKTTTPPADLTDAEVLKFAIAGADAATKKLEINGTNKTQLDVSPDEYTVTFNENGATIGTVPDPITNPRNTNTRIPGNTGNLIKTDFAFMCWNTQADGLGKDYRTDDAYSEQKSITLYARWRPYKEITIGTAAQSKMYNGTPQAFDIIDIKLGGNLNAAITAGSFVVTYSPTGTATYVSTAPTNAGVYDVKITRAIDTTNEAKAFTVDCKLTITKANINADMFENPSAILYGDTLSESIFSATTLGGIAGVYSWTTPDTTTPITVATDGEIVLKNATFTPTDNVNYNVVTKDVNLTVNYREIKGVETFTEIIDKEYSTSQELLGLPKTATLTVEKLTGDSVNYVAEATITAWGGYDPLTTAQQTLTGTLALPAGVKQPATALTATISVTLKNRTPGAVTYSPKTDVYNGSLITHEITLPTGVASIAYKYVGKAPTVYAENTIAPTNAGTYSVTATFRMSDGYSQIEPKTTDLTITPKELLATMFTGDFASKVYNGSKQDPNFVISDKNGGATEIIATSDYSVSWQYKGVAEVDFDAGSATKPGFINAGTYKVTVTPTGNYKAKDLENYSKEFSITAKPLDVVWTKEVFTYNGKQQKHTASVDTGIAGETVLPVKVTVPNGDGINATAAGATYTETASITNANYSLINNFTNTYSIAPAVLTITADDFSLTYGTAIPTYTVKYSGFVNSEDANKLGGALAFACDYTATSSVNATGYTVTPSGLTSTNYAITFTPGKVVVSAKPITVEWDNLTYTYSGKAQAPMITNLLINGDKFTITLSAKVDSALTGTSAIDFGSYTATATASNNYTLTTNTKDFTINKATIDPTDFETPSAIFYGDTLSESIFSATTLGGIAGVYSWTTPDAVTAITVETDGKTVSENATFTPQDTKNYNIATKNVDLKVNYRTIQSVQTFDPITGKEYATVQTALGLPKTATLTVEKLAADSVNYVAEATITWNGYDPLTIDPQTLTGTLTLPAGVKQPATALTATISVTLKNRTPGAVTYSPKTDVYNGSLITHEITLPTGVASIAYKYVGKAPTDYIENTIAPTNAGTYSVTATFTMLNGYEQIVAKTTDLTITQKALTDAMLDINQGGGVYNGSAYTPNAQVADGTPTIIQASDYKVTWSYAPFVGTVVDNYTGTYIDAGTYTATVTAATSGNYSRSVSKEFTITKATPTVTYTIDNENYGTTAFTSGELVVIPDTANIQGVGTTALTDGTLTVKVVAPAASTASKLKVGTYGTSYTYTVSDLNKNNYNDIAATTVESSLKVTPITLAPAIIAKTITKVYDGTTTATVARGDYSLGGLIDKDVVELSGYTSAYASKNVENAENLNNVTVTYGVNTLAGADAGNYLVDGGTLTYTGAITAKELTATWGVNAFTYKGTPQAPTATLTAIAGDTITYAVTGAKTNANPTETPYTATVAFDETGVDNGNYTIKNNTQTFTIAKKAVTVAQKAGSTLTKIYDGNNNCDTTFVKDTQYAIAGVEETDKAALDITISSQVFDDANISATKVTATFILNDYGKTNYSCAATTFEHTATITPIKLTITKAPTAQQLTKAYDGLTSFAVSHIQAVDYVVTTADNGGVLPTGYTVKVQSVEFASKEIAAEMGTDNVTVTMAKTDDASGTNLNRNFELTNTTFKMDGQIVNSDAKKDTDYTVTLNKDSSNGTSGIKDGVTYASDKVTIGVIVNTYDKIRKTATDAWGDSIEFAENATNISFQLKKNAVEEYEIVVVPYGIDTANPTIANEKVIDIDVVGGNGFFKDDLVKVSFDVADINSGIANIELKKGGTIVTHTLSGGAVVYEIAWAENNTINDTYVLTITDYAGRTATATLVVDKHDNVAPTIADTIGGNAIDYTKWVGNGTIDFTLSDATSGIATKVWTADGSLDATVADTFSKTFVNGHHAFKLVVTDNAGNSTTLETPLLVDDNLATFMAEYNKFDSEATAAEKDKKAAALNALFDGYTVTQKEHITGTGASNAEADTAYKALQTYITGRQKEIEAERISQETQRVKAEIAAITGANPTTQSELEKFVKQLPLSKEVEGKLTSEEKQHIVDIVAVEKVVDLLNAKPNNNAQLENWLKTYNALSETQKTLAQKVVETLADRNTTYVGYKTAVDELIAGAKDLSSVNAKNKVEIEALITKYNALTATENLPSGITSKALVPQNVAAKIEKWIASIDKAAAVDGKIGSIGTAPADYTKEFNNKVVEAEKAYKELTADEKTLVNNVTALEDAKKANEELKKKLATSDKAAAEAADFERKFSELPTKPMVKDVLEIYEKYEKLSTEAKAKLDGTQTKTDLDAWKTAADVVFTKDDTTKIINRIENIDLKTLEKATAEEIATIKTEIKSVITEYNKLVGKQKELVDNTAGDKYHKLADLMARLDAAEKAINDIPTENAADNHNCGLCKPGSGTAHDTDNHQTLIEKAKIAYEKLSATERKLLDSAAVTKIGAQYENLKDYLGKLAQQKIIKDKAEKENVSVYGLATLVDTSAVPDIAIADTIVISVDAKKTDSKMNDLDEEKQKVISFDVKLMAKAGNNEAVQIQPKENQMVVVKLSLGQIYAHEKIQIYHNKNDGSRELVQNVNFIDEENQTYAIFGTNSFSEFFAVTDKKKADVSVPDGDAGGSISGGAIFDRSVENEIRFKDTNPVLVDVSKQENTLSKSILDAINDAESGKVIKVIFKEGELSITKETLKGVALDKKSYTYAELKALLEKPEVTPTPTPTPTEKPTEPTDPTEPTTKKCWLCGACPMFLGICLWIWLAIAVVAVAAVVVFIVLKKKKKNDKK